MTTKTTINKDVAPWGCEAACGLSMKDVNGSLAESVLLLMLLPMPACTAEPYPILENCQQPLIVSTNDTNIAE